MLSETLVILALVFLGLHLLTDARRLVQVILTQHSRAAHRQQLTLTKGPTVCPRCLGVDNTLKEAWWEVLTFIVLIAHITLDYI